MPPAENEQNTEYKVQEENSRSTTLNTKGDESAMNQHYEGEDKNYDDEDMEGSDELEGNEWTDENKEDTQQMVQEENQNVTQEESQPMGQEENEQKSHEENNQMAREENELMGHQANEQMGYEENEQIGHEENEQVGHEENDQMIQNSSQQMLHEDNQRMKQAENVQMTHERNDHDVKTNDEQDDDESVDEGNDENMDHEEEHQLPNDCDNGKSVEQYNTYDQQNSINPLNNENGTDCSQLPSDQPNTSQSFDAAENYDNSYSNEENTNQITGDDHLNAHINTTHQMNKDDDDLKSMIDDLTNDMVTQLNSMASTTADDNLDQNSCNAVDNTTESNQFCDIVSMVVAQPPPPPPPLQQTTSSSAINEIDLSSVNVPTFADELKLLEDISDDSLGDMSSHGEDSRNIDWELERRLLDDVPN